MNGTSAKELILIIDNSPEDVSVLVKNLKSEYETVLATSGEEAFKILSSGGYPDLILLGINMPGLNGYQVFTRLKADPSTRDIPVIFLSVRPFKEDEIKDVDTGVHDYITKPFKIPVVKARIRSVLNLKKETDQRLFLKQQLETVNRQMQKRVRERTAQLQDARKALAAHEERCRILFKRADPDDDADKSILIVDDTPENIHILVKNLGAEYRTFFATSGEEALKVAFSEARPDLILLDIVMPKMDGYEVCARLKADPRTRDIPVIFISARDQAGDEIKGLELGAADYITKPFSMTVVRARIETVLRLKAEMDCRLKVTGELEGLNVGLERRVQEKAAELKQAHEDLKISEQRYRSVFENALEGIFQTTPDGSLLSVSPSLARILEYDSPDQLLETVGNLADLHVRPEDGSHFLRALERDGEISGFETRFYRKSGDILWGLVSAKIIGHKEGLPQYCQGFLAEITERKKAQEALRLSEEKYRSIFENTLEGIYQATPDGRIISANPAMAGILGYETAGEFMDTITDMGSQLYANRKDREELLHRLREQGEAKRFEVQFLHKDNSTIWVELTARPIFDSNGRLVRVEGLMADISAQKKAEEEKARLEEQLRQTQKMEALGTLTGGIAHDFNNLLQIMCGHVQMLLMKKDETDPDYKYLSHVNLAASRASELVQRLLTFSRKMEIKVRELDLNEVIQDTLKLLDRTIPKMVAMESSLAPDLSKIQADSSQMEQVIMNLAVNAMDAMDEMGKLFIETQNFTVDKRYRSKYPELQSGEYVLLKVADTGSGIDEKTRQRIFEPFFTTKELGKGTGLGLATVYGIIKGHGGHISCYSEVGVGTTFNIYLPVKHFEQAGVVEEPEEDGAIRGGTETILLVDDEEMILDLSEDILTHQGYTVLRADTAEGALDIYSQEKERIQLVILDLGMPGMGGEKCLQALRKIDPRVKAIVASGYSAHKIAINPEQYGAVGFLNKPFRVDALLRIVSGALNQP